MRYLWPANVYSASFSSQVEIILHLLLQNQSEAAKYCCRNQSYRQHVQFSLIICLDLCWVAAPLLVEAQMLSRRHPMLFWTLRTSWFNVVESFWDCTRASTHARIPPDILFLCFHVIGICLHICLCRAYVSAFLAQATLDKTLGAKASRARLHTSYQPADLDAFRTGQSWHSTLLS